MVDGPPGNEEGIERSRHPALPVLGERLGRGAMVILDDAERPGEQGVLENWGTGHADWDFTIRDGGIAIGVRSG